MATSPPLDEVSHRRRRASRKMLALIVICALIPCSAAVNQVVTHGWAVFVARPPGVGASETVDGADDAATEDAASADPATDAGAAAETPAPTPTTSVPPANTAPPARQGRRRPPPPRRPSVTRRG